MSFVQHTLHYDDISPSKVRISMTSHTTSGVLFHSQLPGFVIQIGSKQDDIQETSGEIRTTLA